MHRIILSDLLNTLVNRKSATVAAAAVVASLAVAAAATVQNEAHADSYLYVNDITPILTFEFKDGTEVHEFPVFKMNDDFVENNGSPGFTIMGVIGEAPHLHRMLDTAFKHKYSSSHEWNYQYARVTVDYTRDGEPVKTLAYHDCAVEDYFVTTLSDDYESYISPKTGFALVDEIEFLCNGLDISSQSEAYYDPTSVKAYETPFEYHNNIRTFVEFGFDQGIERIEFPYFELTGGFAEDTRNVVPSFRVEGIVGDYPLLYKAIDNARGVKGIAAHSNVDFEARVQFIRDGAVLRALDFEDCRTTDYRIKTLFDKEEGFTGKSGFASVEEIGVECVGLDGVNPRYDAVYGDASWQTGRLSYDAPDPGYSSSGGLAALVTFEYDRGRETAVFPAFKQGDVLGLDGTGVSVPPAFELTGQISDLPMLYRHADQNLDLSFTTGANNFIDLFNVDVQMVSGGASAQVIRGFEYNDCRVTDYVVRTQHDTETSYLKGFAHSNTFDFECLGYHPYNPLYDAMFASERPDGAYSSLDYQKEQGERAPKRPLFR